MNQIPNSSINVITSSKQFEYVTDSIKKTHWLADNKGQLHQIGFWRFLTETIKGWMGLENRASDQVVTTTFIKLLENDCQLGQVNSSNIQKIKEIAFEIGLIQKDIALPFSVSQRLKEREDHHHQNSDAEKRNQSDNLKVSQDETHAPKEASAPAESVTFSVQKIPSLDGTDVKKTNLLPNHLQAEPLTPKIIKNNKWPTLVKVALAVGSLALIVIKIGLAPRISSHVLTSGKNSFPELLEALSPANDFEVHIAKPIFPHSHLEIFNCPKSGDLTGISNDTCLYSKLVAVSSKKQQNTTLNLSKGENEGIDHPPPNRSSIQFESTGLHPLEIGSNLLKPSEESIELISTMVPQQTFNIYKIGVAFLGGGVFVLIAGLCAKLSSVISNQAQTAKSQREEARRGSVMQERLNKLGLPFELIDAWAHPTKKTNINQWVESTGRIATFLSDETKKSEDISVVFQAIEISFQQPSSMSAFLAKLDLTQDLHNKITQTLMTLLYKTSDFSQIIAGTFYNLVYQQLKCSLLKGDMTLLKDLNEPINFPTSLNQLLFSAAVEADKHDMIEELLKLKSISLQDEKDYLKLALSKGFSLTARKLISLGANLKRSPYLIHVLQTRLIEDTKKALIALLIHNGADICQTDSQNNTIIHIAASQSPSLLSFFLENKEKIDINAKNKDGNSVLHEVVKQHKPDLTVIKLLVDNGADCTLLNQKNQTALDLAFLLRKGNEAMNLLLSKATAPLNRLTESDQDRTSLFDDLLKAGVDPNEQDINGNTAMHLVTQRRQSHLGGSICIKNIEYIIMLMENEADPNIPNKQGITPLSCIIGSKEISEIAPLVVEKYKQLYHRPTTGDLTKWTPLHQAVYEGNEQAFSQVLNDAETDVNAFTEQQVTPLMIAVDRQDIKMVKELLDSKANPCAADSSGITPLHVACLTKNIALIDLITTSILDQKGDLDAPSHGKITPLMLSLFLSDEKAIALMASKGVNLKCHLYDKNVWDYFKKLKKDQQIQLLKELEPTESDELISLALIFRPPYAFNILNTITELNRQLSPVSFTNVTNRLGHALELGGHVSHSLPKPPPEKPPPFFIPEKIPLEGSRDRIWFKTMAKETSSLIGKYPEIASNENFSKEDFWKQTLYMLNFGADLDSRSHTQILKRILKGKPTLISSGPYRHSTQVLFSNDPYGKPILVLCNRTAYQSCHAFYYNPEALTKEMIKEILPSQNNYRTRKEYENLFFQKLKERLDLKTNDFTKFLEDNCKLTRQKVGNCTWASLEMGMYIHCILSAIKNKSKPFEAALDQGEFIYNQWCAFQKIRALEAYLDLIEEYNIKPVEKAFINDLKHVWQLLEHKKGLIPALGEKIEEVGERLYRLLLMPIG